MPRDESDVFSVARPARLRPRQCAFATPFERRRRFGLALPGLDNDGDREAPSAGSLISTGPAKLVSLAWKVSSILRASASVNWFLSASLL
jgi:hypothetical protein